MTLSFNGAHVLLAAGECLVVCVRARILDDPYECELLHIAFEHRFRVPVVLMAQDEQGRPTFHGRSALVAALRRVPVMALPWQRYAPQV